MFPWKMVAAQWLGFVVAAGVLAFMPHFIAFNFDLFFGNCSFSVPKLQRSFEICFSFWLGIIVPLTCIALWHVRPRDPKFLSQGIGGYDAGQ